MILRLVSLLQSLAFVVLCLFDQAFSSDISVLVSGAVANRSRTACLVCRTDAAQPPKDMTFEWTNQDRTRVNRDTTSVEDSDDSSTLCFKLIDENALGSYSCFVSVNGTTRIGSTAALESEPFFKKTSRSQLAIEGDNLKITCKSWGSPRPNVQWQLNDEQAGRTRVLPTNQEIDTFVVSSTLEIPKVTKRDQGSYRCIASNRYQTLQSPAIRVRVKGKLAPLWPFVGFGCELCFIAVVVLIVELHKRGRERKLHPETNAETKPQDGQKKPAKTTNG